ncbi:class F sortase [Streptomyces sp. NBC_00683]|uniref:class F sortase n=1 Tax=Streptomyces sp. NBC_00683 TaxID=2903670 RepID=UPI002E361E6F|nr:class F sortase [Streptomyces sp. NBC_00683]
MPRTAHVFRRALMSSAAAVLILVPLTGCSTSGAAQPPAAVTSASGAAERPNASESPNAPAPTQISIPSIGVTSQLMRLGLNADGTVEVPPADKGMTAGWYAGGAVPGEPGAAVVIGHNDTRFGKAVFHDLKRIAEGADITVLNGLGERTHFTVTGTETVSKSAFPSEKVYGETGDRVLRLITCDGSFDADGHPVDNLIVYATLS